MKTLLVQIARTIAQLVALFALLLGIYAGWEWWQVRQLTAFCGQALPGTAVSALPALAESFGFNGHWIERGVREKNGPGFVTFLPASSTMGDVVCAIHYNEVAVVHAEVWQ